VDWAALKAAGFKAVVFDKDNTLTVPFETQVSFGHIVMGIAPVENAKLVYVLPSVKITEGGGQWRLSLSSERQLA
jgi:predicted HAD superfamily phosphohydrolase YqeG